MHRSRAATSGVVRFFRDLDYLQLAAAGLLLAIGAVFIRSIGIQIGSPAAVSYFSRQLTWITVGMAAYLFFAIVDYRRIQYRVAVLVMYVVCIILLVVVLFWGKEINNATRWLLIGGIRVQPSEPAKFALIAVLAGLLASNSWKSKRWQTFLLTLAAVGVPCVLIIKEPDMGSALMLLPIYFSMLFVAGIKWRHVMIGLVGVMLIGIVGVIDYNRENPVLLRKYQRNRIRIFLDPTLDVQNLGHQPYQARLGVGSGGWSGKGIGRGTQNALGFLPQMAAHNDFIFSVIAEETGFCGVAVLLLLYAILLYTMLRTAFFAPPYGRLLAVGTAVMFFFHIFINIGMSIGVTPVSGLSLPLISYGGSFIVITMAMLGLMQSIRTHH